MQIFCTLFDSYYLDKGITMYHSLEECTSDFKLYIFAFDDKAYEILKGFNLNHAVIIHYSEIEDKELLRLKTERSKAEYCWTCTPVIIEYVLKHYGEPSCTYIDSDLYFFGNPQILFDEIIEAKANIVITEHRFKDSWNGRRLCKRSGKYCVEFNYFDQSENAWKALAWWRKKCIEWCYHLYEPERMGDQKYLEKFPKLFKGVYELRHLGGGVAPWNLGQYELKRMEKGVPILFDKKSGVEFPIVFYHFQNIRFLSENTVNISSGTYSRKTKDAIYIPYLKEIDRIRKLLREYGMAFDVKKIYASNKLVAFLQGGLLRFKIKSFTDIYRLKRLR